MGIPRIDGAYTRFTAPPPPPAPPPRQHEVRHGESIATIAKAEGTTAQKLLAANPQVVNPDVLYPGQRINLPAEAPAANAASANSIEVKPETNTRTGDEANGTKSTATSGVAVNDQGGSVSGSQTDKTTRTDPAGTAETSSTSRSGSVGVDTEKGTVSVTGGLGFSEGLKSAKGYGVSFGVNAESTVVAGRKTTDGVTTYSASADVSVTLKAGADVKQAGLEVGHTEGIRSSYEVSMPEQVARNTDLTKVNPFDPDSMPTGTVIKLDGSHYSGNEFKATFRNIAAESKIANFEGSSLLVEKTGTDLVRVTTGPTEAIEAYNGIGVDFEVAKVMLGRSDQLDGATLKTAEFNLASADGRAAYNDYLATGKMPTDNGNGVSDVATIEKVDFSSQTKLEAKLGPIKLGLDGAKNTGNSVVTTHADGTKSATTDLQYSDNVPMTLSRKFDASGNEIMSERRYSYTIEADDNVAQLLNAAQGGGRENAASGPVKGGDTVVLTYTEAEMGELLGHADKALEAAQGMDFQLSTLIKDYDGNTVKTWDFALGMARNLGATDYGTAERLFRISEGADGQSFDDNAVALPGTVTIVARTG